MQPHRIPSLVAIATAAFAVCFLPAFPAFAQSTTGTVLPDIPVISIRATAPETHEPFCDPAVCDAAVPAPAAIVVSRKGGDPANELAVSIQVEGTALNGVDYASLPAFVVFRSGVDSVELLIEPAYDLLKEGDEYVVVRLLPDPTLGPIERYQIDPAQAAARAVIHDTQVPVAPMVSIEATSPIAEESSYPLRRLVLRGRFTISRTGPTEFAQTVFVIFGGSATPGIDYVALPWLVTIPAGTNQTTLVVEPIPDLLPEGIEIVNAQLSQCPPLTDPPLGMPCFAVDIDPQRSSARVFIREDGVSTATLHLTAPSPGRVFGANEPTRVAAIAIDLEGAITHVEFFDGEARIGESNVAFIRPPEPGTPIEHEFIWTGASPGAHVITARALNTAGLAITSAPVRVQVTDGLPVVSITASVPETTEPSPTSRIRPGAFTLRRTGATDAPLTVALAYGGTAMPLSDYDPLPRLVEFPSGSASVELSVVPVDDDLVEGDETVVAELVPALIRPGTAPGYQIDPLSYRARVVIHDNDLPALPVVSIRATVPETREPILCRTQPCPMIPDLAPAAFRISRTGSALAALEVRYVLGGTARNGADYRLLPGVALIPAGAEGVDVLVAALPDELSEGDETVVAELYLPPLASPIDPYRIDPANARAGVVIHDSPLAPPPVPMVSVVAVDAFAREGLNSSGVPDLATFVVHRSGPTNDALKVGFALGGTALNGVDYSELSTPVVIPAGQRDVRLIVKPVDDQNPERLESVLLTLLADPSTSPAYGLGAPRRAAVVIADNDQRRPPCLRLPDGLFNLCLPMDGAGCVQVEVTDDLKEWTPICTVPLADGVAHFVDPDAGPAPHRFYRLVPVPCAP